MPPTKREPCWVASFKATALGSISRGTRFGTRDWVVVICAERKVPFIKDKPTSHQILTNPTITSTASRMLWARFRV